MANSLAVDDDEKIRDLLYVMLRRKPDHVLRQTTVEMAMTCFVGSDLT